VVEKMKSLLKKLFLDHWQRKFISFLLAMVIWMVIDHSMIVTKTLTDIPVKISNVPPGKTIENMQLNNILNKKISLVLTGNKNVLDELTGSDLEVILDASDKGDEWVATVTKKNLICFNPDINILQGITKVSHQDFIIKLAKQITEKIPIFLSTPIGEAPKNYQFLDIYPVNLSVTVTGTESTIKKLKTTGFTLTFNLNDISEESLNTIRLAQKNQDDEVSFFVPHAWKKIIIPEISSSALEIDDPDANALRITFVQKTLIPINNPIAVTVFYPEKNLSTINPKTYPLIPSDLLQRNSGVFYIKESFCAKGVSQRFVDIVKERIEIVAIAVPKTEKDRLLWNVLFLSPLDLENRYVASILSDSTEDTLIHLPQQFREEALRNRFRSYMSAFRLYKSTDKKLHLNIQLENNAITVNPVD
jgi:hypothetical protein